MASHRKSMPVEPNSLARLSSSRQLSHVFKL
jgi:hypothetical protein